MADVSVVVTELVELDDVDCEVLEEAVLVEDDVMLLEVVLDDVEEDMLDEVLDVVLEDVLVDVLVEVLVEDVVEEVVYSCQNTHHLWSFTYCRGGIPLIDLD